MTIVVILLPPLIHLYINEFLSIHFTKLKSIKFFTKKLIINPNNKYVTINKINNTQHNTIYSGGILSNIPNSIIDLIVFPSPLSFIGEDGLLILVKSLVVTFIFLLFTCFIASIPNTTPPVINPNPIATAGFDWGGTTFTTWAIPAPAPNRVPTFSIVLVILKFRLKLDFELELDVGIFSSPIQYTIFKIYEKNPCSYKLYIKPKNPNKRANWIVNQELSVHFMNLLFKSLYNDFIFVHIVFLSFIFELVEYDLFWLLKFRFILVLGGTITFICILI
uniref:hypothetical protein n=1 Tax=Conidiobolus polyspermus TaxID=2074866 RepID=UPI001D1014B3|nr:hypothetical protein LKZ09_mgp09 [Conidiobolus polyspermus]QZZ81364.1 hypothetical protein [Conidiobolus polyspermus]